MSNVFAESLAMSHAAEDLPLWEEVYRYAFPEFQAMVNHRQDGDHQRAGIDRTVVMSNSKVIKIDEKVRARNKITGRVYSDIALEYWSNEERRVRGWVCKSLLCDYIAYAIAPLGKCYLLPVPQLRRAWIENGKAWVKRFPIVRAVNENGGSRYTTVSVAVPPGVLMAAIKDALIVDFSVSEDGGGTARASP